MDPVRFDVRGRTLDEVVASLSSVSHRISRPTPGSASVTVGSIVAYRFFGVHLGPGRRRLPMRVDLRAEPDGVAVVVCFRDAWAPLRIDKERGAFAERASYLRSLMTG